MFRDFLKPHADRLLLYTCLSQERRMTVARAVVTGYCKENWRAIERAVRGVITVLFSLWNLHGLLCELRVNNQQLLNM